MEENNIGAAYTLKQLVQYFFKLGYAGFGGPVALIGYMHRDLVEERDWITEEEYKDGLALAQLAPGPLAAQLGIYIGFVHYRILGATLCGLAFVLPSFVMVVIIGFSNYDINLKRVFEYNDINSEPFEKVVKNIKPYLVEGKDLYVVIITSSMEENTTFVNVGLKAAP